MRKVALGIKLTSGPFGGGNQFGQSLARYLRQHHITVVDTLRDNDIDLILVTDTRRWLASCAYDARDALRYRRRLQRTKIILRINECDQRKGAPVHHLNRLIAVSSEAADHVVFISRYLRSLFPTIRRPSTVILNGADTAIFNTRGFRPWNGVSLLKLVTHHWSSHPYKGWDVYQALDAMLGKQLPRVAFTYLGRLPTGASLPNSRVLAPLAGPELAAVLKEHHAYITASLHEPAGMHHIEGAACGLPLLYRESGALPEYCTGFGLPFRGPSELVSAIHRLQREYKPLVQKMVDYPHSSERMCREYFDLFERVRHEPSAAKPAWLTDLRISAALVPLRVRQFLP